ncbi:uncharacterized protein LOC130010252 isoform X2 [Patella vulgata]|nr:uncharacterized protein LOC130010252 isoform X2 [Patella vulgata]
MAEQIRHFKQREEEQQQREEEQKRRKLQLKRREDMMQRLSLPCGKTSTEEATVSAYQHVEYQESLPDAKRRGVISRGEKGKMLPEDDSRILSNYVYLTENLDPLEPLLDSLYDISVLNEDDLDKIRRAESSGSKAMIRQFLDVLRTCGINAYPKFIECLIKSGYGAVAEQVDSSEMSSRTNYSPDACDNNDTAYNSLFTDTEEPSTIPRTDDSSHINIVLTGRTGDGKGYTGNYLIGKPVAEQLDSDDPASESNVYIKDSGIRQTEVNTGETMVTDIQVEDKPKDDDDPASESNEYIKPSSTSQPETDTGKKLVTDIQVEAKRKEGEMVKDK